MNSFLSFQNFAKQFRFDRLKKIESFDVGGKLLIKFDEKRRIVRMNVVYEACSLLSMSVIPISC
jgi:hypothetical protein